MMEAKLLLFIFVSMLSLSFATYNSHGHGVGRWEYINKLSECHDFILLQEHWLFDKQIDSITNFVDGVNVVGVSGMKDTDLIYGRPYGGCAILWKKGIEYKVSPISFQSRRVCAVLCDHDQLKMLVINVYMPCDTGRSGDDSNEYCDILNEISLKCHALNIDNIIIGGDFNTDMSRLGSLHTKHLLSFVYDERLVFCLENNVSQVDYSFESKVNHETSTIDHFLLSEN